MTKLQILHDKPAWNILDSPPRSSASEARATLHWKTLQRQRLSTELYLLTNQLTVILCKIRVILKGRRHGTSPIRLTFCMKPCIGVLTTKWMF